MPRIRTLLPDIWNDEDFGLLGIEAQDLYIGLITQADDEARLKGSPTRLRALIWPYKPEIADEQVDTWLEEITARGLIVRYEVDGKQYISLRGWHNQRIHKPTASKLPAPPAGADPSGAPAADPPGAALTSSELFATSRDSSQKVALEVEGKGEGETPPPSETLAMVARRLFAHWQQQCQHPQAKFTLDRRRKLEARLREGYSESDIRQAIDGAARAAFVNPDGKRFDDLELICRSGSKLEDFMGRAVGATRPNPHGVRNLTSAELAAALNSTPAA